MLKHGILGLLNYGSMTGYEIREVFRDSLNYFWTAQTSQIYRELHGLEGKGLVRSVTVPQGGRPDRKVFSITDAGREELISWLAKPFAPEARVGFLMQTFFMGELPPGQSIAKFQQLKAFFKLFDGGLAEPDESTRAYASRIDHPERGLYWAMTVDYGRRYAHMMDEWCDACIDVLSNAEGGAR